MMNLFLSDYDKKIDFKLNLIDQIAQKFQLNKEYINIKKNEKGKPYIENHSDIHLGISHSKDKIIYGYSNVKFGIDIEKVRNLEHFNNSFFKKVLTSNEYNFLFKESKSFDKDFIKIWTKKEAYLKYLGIGISEILNIIDTFEIENNIYCFEIDDYIISIFVE